MRRIECYGVDGWRGILCEELGDCVVCSIPKSVVGFRFVRIAWSRNQGVLLSCTAQEHVVNQHVYCQCSLPPAYGISSPTSCSTTSFNVPGCLVQWNNLPDPFQGVNCTNIYWDIQRKVNSRSPWYSGVRKAG
jgi:hypothetical protein